MTGLCLDCGMDTTPCTRKRGCRHRGRWEWYMVNRDLWMENVPEDDIVTKTFFPTYYDPVYLCVGCLEKRIGRLLAPSDFTDAEINDPDHPWCTPRLASRLRGNPVESP